MSDPKVTSKELPQPETETPVNEELLELLNDKEEYLWG